MRNLFTLVVMMASLAGPAAAATAATVRVAGTAMTCAETTVRIQTFYGYEWRRVRVCR